MNNLELYHHGILGQKWGVRRYQNPDGSLTPEGVKRYAIESYKRDYILAPNIRARSTYKKSSDRRNKIRAVNQLKREQSLNTDPYGSKKDRQTKEEKDRRYYDEWSYGKRTTSRIERKVYSGKTYKRARNEEIGKKIVAGYLIGYGIIDYKSGGAVHRYIGQILYSSLRKTADKAVMKRAEKAARNAIPKLAQEMVWDITRKKWIHI